jgi:magnesium transporter
MSWYEGYGMIEYYALDGETFIRIEAPGNQAKKISWCDVRLSRTSQDENERDIDLISKKFNVNYDDLKELLDVTERPRYSYDVLLRNQFLLLRGTKTAQYEFSRTTLDISVTLPIGLFLTANDEVITVHYLESTEFTNIVARLNKKVITLPIYLFLELIEVVFSMLDKSSFDVARQITRVQAAIIKAPRAIERVNEPFLLNSYMIYFATAMHGNNNALQSFITKNKALFDQSPALSEKVDDLRADIEQVLQISAIYHEQVQNMLNQVTNISNNSLNRVLKTVGSISLIVSIPTLISSFYGMNLRLPGEGIDWGFYLVVGISFVISAAIWLLFRKLRWL